MTSASPDLHPKYRPDIDGLRAVAVAAVVIFHAFPQWLPGGYVGVDVFFVISGYLISSILIKSLQADRFSLADFYSRRIRRIFPALLLMLVATLAAGWWVMMPDEYARLGLHSVAGASFLSNFVLWRESGYFDSAAETKPLLHLWSLAIEEQFYIFWPLVLAAAWRLWRRAGAVLLACALVSLAWSIWSVRHDPVAGFFSPISRAWELLAGAALAYLTVGMRHGGWHKRISHLIDAPVRRHVASVLGVCLIGFAVFHYQQKTPFPGAAAILPVLGSVLVIAAGPAALLNRLWLSQRGMVWIGLISYPLYLWHWPLLTFPRLMGWEQAAPWITPVMVLVSVALAWATFAGVEKPLRSGRVTARVAVAALAGLMALTALASFMIYRSGGWASRPTVAPYVSVDQRGKAQIAWPYAENDVCLKRYPSDLRTEGWWFCVMNRDAAPEIVLLGNSFANHLYAGFAANTELGRHTILQFGTCDPAMGVRYDGYPRGHGCFAEGRDRQERFINGIIEREGTVKYAVLAAPWPRFDEAGFAVGLHDGKREPGQYSSVVPVSQETSEAALLAGIERRVKWLVGRGIVPILMLGTPQLEYSPLNCLASRPFAPQSAFSCTVPMSDVQTQQQAFRRGVEDIRRRVPELKVFDPLPALCDADTCHLQDQQDGLLLRDVGHLSMAGSKRVADAFARWARSNVPGMARATNP